MTSAIASLEAAGAIALSGALLFGAPAAAHAQDGPSLRAHQITVGAGAGWAGPYGIGDAAAELRGNGVGSLPPVFTLFMAKSRITSAFSPEVRVGYAVSRAIGLEFSFAYSQPHVSVAISEDDEAAPQQLPGEQLRQYLIGGAVTWQPPIPARVRARIGNRLAPFVLGGGTFLRQLHEDRTLGETGQVYYAGGGARYFVRGGGGGRAIGVRGDARVNFRVNGIDFEDQMRTYPSFSLAAFVGF